VTGDTAVDVAVVGGGPGGAAVAIGCARQGLDCLLLDVDAGDRAGGTVGETLHPGVDVVFRELGVAGSIAAAGFVRHEGHWVEWGGPAVFQAFGSDHAGPWRGYQAPRDVLDPLLVDAAERAGAAVRRGCRVVSAVVAPDDDRPAGLRRVTGVVTATGTLSARVVVDAGGRRHWLDRQVGRSVRRVTPPLVVAHGHRPRSAEDHPRLRASPDGWTWEAPVTADTVSWARLSLRRAGAGGGRGADGWADAPGATVRSGTPARRPRGADVTWRCAERAAGPGWFLVGDAAAVVDPTASHGVLRALMSGAVAARAIADRASGRVTEDQAAARYTRWVTDWFHHDVARLHELYRLFPAWPTTLGTPPPTSR
jgi:flavin-dependent dehydrogenase